MDTAMVVDLARQALWITMIVSAPLLGVALAVGLFIGIIQAATSINEMTLSFIPKLIALGLALLIFGSGPVRGFAVVHCLGIVTSIFSSVVVSRAVVNLWYGRKKKLDSVSIGQIWRPDGGADVGNNVAKKA